MYVTQIKHIMVIWELLNVSRLFLLLVTDSCGFTLLILTQNWSQSCHWTVCLSHEKSTREWQTYCYALSHYTGLFHSARPPELLHVFAEVALPALGPQAGLALPTAGPSPPGARCSPTGWQLDCWCRRSCHLRFRPIGRPGLKGWRGYGVRYQKPSENRDTMLNK